jgi:hypothetical protein
MTLTDPAHVTTAKALRERYQQPRPAPDPHDSLVRDLADYDRAFGLSELAPNADLTDGQVA